MLPVAFITILVITFSFDTTSTHEIRRKLVPVFGVNFISSVEEKDEELLSSSEQINLVENSTAMKQKASCNCKNGTCVVNADGRTVCQCPPEFFLSDDSICKACHCGPGSNCTIEGDMIKLKLCLCKEGYKTGMFTCIGPCTVNPCKNGGTCVDIPNSYKCSCPAEYTGVICERKLPECVCERGECIVNEYGDTVCQCPPGYGNYTQSECVECKCGEGSNCTFSVYGDKFCLCKEGYIQENGRCEKCICGEGSTNCTVNDYGEKVCICKKGYTQVKGKCENCNCGPNAGCRFDVYGRKKCFCLKGYRYVDGKCQDLCNPNPCRNGGECKLVDGDYNCTCEFPNSGRNCEKECSCGPNGKCSFAINGKKICECRDGFTESEGICKVPGCSCGPNGECSLAINGKKICKCRDGFAEFEGLCKECSCGSHSFCFFNNDGDKRCVCLDGYTYDNGKCEEGKKENIVIPVLLGGILVSILFGICLFTCMLCKK